MEESGCAERGRGVGAKGYPGAGALRQLGCRAAGRQARWRRTTCWKARLKSA
jgi:hypothetical protein